MTHVTEEMLKFTNRAKEVFNKNKKWATYRDDNYIALRVGMFEDCIRVYQVEGEGVQFDQWCERSGINADGTFDDETE